MLPILKHLSNQQEYRARDLIEPISDMFGMSDDEKQELLPSGKQRIIDNRIGWARTYLKKAGLLEDPRRGYTKITDRGLDVLSQNPQQINVKYLKDFPEFIEFISIQKNQDKSDSSNVTNIADEIEDVTPDELMERGYELINSNLKQDLLDKLLINSPFFLRK
ncbi:MAG: winged helix-turn-helix domain-containing protein [Methanosarcinaceae archaeon]|nr:winged helix-turn-helix domain-containing protein [Methanosarcinaceae archaeon]